MQDLHIYADLEAFRTHRYCGGSGLALYRDPDGDGRHFVEALISYEVRDVYLHGVALSARERSIILSRQHHPDARARNIYRVVVD